MKPLLFVLLLSISSYSLAQSSGGGSSPFVPLNPPIIVNIMDGKHIRHMQVMIEMKVSDSNDAAAKIIQHNGPIRHKLLLLLSTQTSSSISTAQGKNKLRKDALAVVQETMQELEGAPLVEDLYFTNFIIQ